MIVPDFEVLMEEASKRFILVSEYAELIRDPQLLKLLQKEVEKVNEDLGNWEKIKEFRLIPHSWSLETEELTPTLKLKRRVILDKYASYIRDIYQEDGSDLFEDIEEVSIDEINEEVLEEINNI